MNSIEEEFLNNVIEDKTKPKKRKNSKVKGNRGELELAHILNERFKNLAVFSRTPMSGAYVGASNRDKKNYLTEAQKEMMTSDIFCNNPDFKFSIEHKFYEKLDFYDLLNPSSNIIKWYEQSLQDAKSINKEPLLIIKTNNHKRIVFVTINYLVSQKLNLVPNFIFKGRGCFWLDEILNQKDEFFFNIDKK